jgi:Ca2+-binding RTX toxin-like protein
MRTSTSRWALALACAATAAIALPAGSAVGDDLSATATPPKCFGQPATIYRGSGYPGTSTASPNDPMTIVGTPGDDVIYTANGDDTIDGAGGNDKICGVGGNDKIRGGAGNDEIFGSQGDDDLGGQSGDDQVIGGPGNDRVNGGEGNDKVRGGDGDDIVNGGDGDDQVFGGANDDVLAGNAGTDYCKGGPGNDRVTANGSCETFDTTVVSNNTPAPTAAADRLVVASAEDPNDANGNAASLMPATDAGSVGDVEGGNSTAFGDL